jgi:hypothetical protein
MRSGILKRLAELEAQVKAPPLDLAGVSDTDLQRLEAYFLRLSEVGAMAEDFGALPKRLQRIVLKSMEIV